MTEIRQTQDLESMKTSHWGDHMANERTFLAWIRTSVGIMAFGFVVEKFALFLRQISFLLAQSSATPQLKPFSHLSGYSPAFGIFLVGLGALIGFLAFIKYKRMEKQIETGEYQKSFILEIMLTLSILSVGLFLIIYLIHTI